jgi:hypothetical protein
MNVYFWRILYIWLVVHRLGKIISDDKYEYHSGEYLDNWLLTKKIFNNICNLGYDKYFAEQECRLIRILTRFHRWFDDRRCVEENILSIKSMFDVKDVQIYTGVNHYEGVWYIHKESFEIMVYWLFIVSIMILSPEDKEIYSKIMSRYNIADKLIYTAECSGYKVDDMWDRMLDVLN